MEHPPTPVSVTRERSNPLDFELDLPPPDVPEGVRRVARKTLGRTALRIASARVVRTRADGTKVTFPANSRDRVPASEAIRDRRERSLGQGMAARAAREKAEQSPGETVGRALPAELNLLSRRSHDIWDDEE